MPASNRSGRSDVLEWENEDCKIVLINIAASATLRRLSYSICNIFLNKI